MYFLDTNTCVYFLNGKHASIRDRLLSLAPNEVAIPAIVKAELLFGAQKSQNRKANHEKVERFLSPFDIVPFDDAAAQVYADLRHRAEKKGELIGPDDLLMAAIVKAREGTIVTHNLREFKRIEGLKVEDWVK